MPQAINHIDKIARDKGRDVLGVVFDREVFPGFKYESWEVRNKLLEWFDKNNIKTLSCGPVASVLGWTAYCGQLYIDVPYDETCPDYIKVCAHLENPDGSMRIPGVIFCYYTLEKALENKHHDEPGFWDNWADNF